MRDHCSLGVGCEEVGRCYAEEMGEPKQCGRLPCPEKPDLDQDRYPEGVFEGPDGTLMATCQACEEDYELPCDPEEFNPDCSYCGGSPNCCP